MAKNQTKRLSPKQLELDKEAYEGLLSIKGYKPADNAYSVSNLKTGFAMREKVQAEETAATKAATAARDQAVAGEWKLHNLVLGVRNQVKAQYGEDSDEVESVGLRKKSQRRGATKKKPAKKPSA